MSYNALAEFAGVFVSAFGCGWALGMLYRAAYRVIAEVTGIGSL